MAPGLNATTCVRKATSNGAWQGDNPVEFSLPLLIVQMCIVLAVTRTLAFFLRPLRQPRVIAEIIGGILLGPSALGKNKEYMRFIFPKDSITVLDTIANLGLVFFLFMVGLELDLKAIRRTGKQALSISIAGIAVPFVAGVGVSFVLHDALNLQSKFSAFLVFMGVAMSITAFPVLARILAELKLLTTDVGQLAMSAAAVDDVTAWVLLAIAVAMSGTNASPSVAAWVLLCGIAFVILMFVFVKPLMTWLARQTLDNEPVNELHVAITLAAVLIAAFITDAIGIHSIFGAFIFGLVIPKEGPFAGTLIEKIEDLVTILMLPLYFAASGLKTNIGTINNATAGGLLVLVIVTACAGKIIGVFLVAIAHKVAARKALALALLMNTKGLVELIVLNIGKDRKVLNDEAFAIMVLMALFTTFLTTPAVMAVYKPARKQVPYTKRTIEHAEPDNDSFRLLACVHGITNVNAIISLVEASRGMRKRVVKLFILHLVELSERSSSILRVQRAKREGLPFSKKNKREFENHDNVVVAFEAYSHLSKVAVNPMTVVSNFDDMHEDICGTAAEKHACIILLPFHKYAHSRDPDAALESYNPGFRSVNHRVLQYAPCSVAILIDRGIGISALSSSDVHHNVTMFFFGGADDREALLLGYRMAEHPGVHLTVIRFLTTAGSTNGLGDHHSVHMGNQSINSEGPTSTRSLSLSSRLNILTETYNFSAVDVDVDTDIRLDEECLQVVKTKSVGESPNMSYEEMVTSNAVDSMKELAKKNSIHLILVGIARRPTPMLAHLAGTPADQCAELGPIGDALASSGKGIHASVLVVQQHDPTLMK